MNPLYRITMRERAENPFVLTEAINHSWSYLEGKKTASNGGAATGWR